MTFAALCARAALATALVVNIPSVLTGAAAQDAKAQPKAAVTVASGQGTVTTEDGGAKTAGAGTGWAVISTPTGHRLVRVSQDWISRRGTVAAPAATAPAASGTGTDITAQTPVAPATGGSEASETPIAPAGEVGVMPMVGGESPDLDGPRPTQLGSGHSPERAIAGITVPGAPQGLIVQPAAGGGIQLSWTDGSVNETAFEVMRQRQAGNNWNRSTTLRTGENETTLVDNPGNGVYRFRVRAVNGSGSSEYTPWGMLQVAGQVPTGPTQLMAADLGNGQEIRITWADNSGDETSFELQRETLSGSVWGEQVTLTAGANQTSYTDAAAIGTFRYRLRAVNSAGASLYTTWATVVVAVASPAAPANVQAADQGNGWQLRVTWADVSTNESGFEVQRQPQTGSTWGLTTTVFMGANVTTLTDGVGPGLFRYRVRAANAFGASAYTDWSLGTVASSTPTAPAAPTGPMATDIGNRRALVSWTDNSGNESGFEIERSPSFGSGSVLVGANVAAYIDQSGPGTFSYRVRAHNTAGASAYSAWANVTVAEVAPAAPSDVQAAASGEAGVALSWADNSNNESGFRVERQTQTESTWGTVTTLSAPADATSLSDTPGAGTHRYRVASTNFAGDSGFTPWTSVGVNGGWTVFTPSADTRIVYVSSSTGNDANSGLSEASPKRTIAAAYNVLRQGYPDWLLLKRGDTWVNEPLANSNLAWQRSGRSASEVMLVSSYGPGTARPLLKTGSMDGSRMLGSSVSTISHLAIVGLEFYAHTRNPSDPSYTSGSGGAGSYPTGINYTKAGQNVLVEDCKFSYYGLGILFQPQDSASTVSDIKVRRCVVTDCYGVGSHSQGMYAFKLDGLLVEECVFDHNGWNETVSGGHATIYNRNMYLSYTPDITLRGNIDANGSSGGTQMRMGGLAERNLFLNNPVALAMGHGENPSGTWHGIMRYNVVLGSRDVSSIPHGWGIGMGPTADGVEVYENIIGLNQLGTNSIQAIFFNGGRAMRNMDIHDNIVHRWDYNGTGSALNFGSNLTFSNVRIRNNTFHQRDGGQTVYTPSSMAGITFSGNRYWSSSSSNAWFSVLGQSYNFGGWASLVGESQGSSSQPSYPDPDRDIGTYMASIGGTPTLQGFMTEARKQSRSNWRSQYTADPVINYIRAGFGKPPAP